MIKPFDIQEFATLDFVLTEDTTRMYICKIKLIIMQKDLLSDILMFDKSSTYVVFVTSDSNDCHLCAQDIGRQLYANT